jgi:replication factor C small subunit
VHIDKPDHVEFSARAATVLISEGIEFDLDTLDIFVKATYPDLRKCMNLLQENSISGVLAKTSAASQSTQDWRLAAVDLFKQGRVQDARKVICSQASSEDMDSVYRWMYDNLELWSSETEKQDQAIVVIRNALVNVPMVADQEINLSACLIELANIGR